MLDFELLRAFVAVADCGGFRRAAERLNLTQSTVSQQIKRLKLETKRPLFRQTTRSVALTDDGEMLLGDARRLLQFGEAAWRRRGSLGRCVSAWSRRSPAAHCLRHSAASPSCIRA
jgi:DNA-binding transcriptional LysR family regulator